MKQTIIFIKSVEDSFLLDLILDTAPGSLSEVGKNRPDYLDKTVQIIWTKQDFFLVQIEIWILSGKKI